MTWITCLVVGWPVAAVLTVLLYNAVKHSYIAACERVMEQRRVA